MHQKNLILGTRLITRRSFPTKSTTATGNASARSSKNTKQVTFHPALHHEYKDSSSHIVFKEEEYTALWYSREELQTILLESIGQVLMVEEEGEQQPTRSRGLPRGFEMLLRSSNHHHHYQQQQQQQHPTSRDIVVEILKEQERLRRVLKNREERNEDDSSNSNTIEEEDEEDAKALAAFSDKRTFQHRRSAHLCGVRDALEVGHQHTDDDEKYDNESKLVVKSIRRRVRIPLLTNEQQTELLQRVLQPPSCRRIRRCR